VFVAAVERTCQIRAGLYEGRQVNATVFSDGVLRLNLSGNVVAYGTAVAIDNMAMATEGAHEELTGWVVNGLVIHKAGQRVRDTSTSAPVTSAQMVEVPGRDAYPASQPVPAWDFIGPFDDANSTGMHRPVSAVDVAGCVTSDTCTADTNTSHMHPCKNGTPPPLLLRAATASTTSTTHIVCHRHTRLALTQHRLTNPASTSARAVSALAAVL
jgi:hypothetical protein